MSQADHQGRSLSSLAAFLLELQLHCMVCGQASAVADAGILAS